MAHRDPLNFYSPYERLPAGHENQLTRALLVLIRMSPIAHSEWLHLVDPARRLGNLPAPAYETQRRALRRGTEQEEQAQLISVFLAPEHPQSGGGQIAESDRNQVLDGIMNYGGELIVAIENKIFDADDLQARNINTTGARIVLADGQQAVVVLWRDLLEAFVQLRERDLVAGAEARILDDFLIYVENHFPDLGPFRHLGLCQGVLSRQTRRIRQLLTQASGTEATEDRWGAWVPTPVETGVVEKAYLGMAESGDAIELRLFPGDTLTQARRFYANASAVERFRSLTVSDGWRAEPNFHFGHMQPGFCWTTCTIELDAYLELWQKRISETRPIPREEWGRFWKWLEKNGMAAPEDRAEFDRHFTATGRAKASPRPGLRLVRHWGLNDAERLDVRGRLASEVGTALQLALRALSEVPIEPPQRRRRNRS